MHRAPRWKHVVPSLLPALLLLALLPGCGPGEALPEPAEPSASTRSAPLGSAPTPLQVVLEPEADAVVSSTQPNVNSGTSTSLTVRSGSSEAYLRFNLSSLPAGARIASVMLQAVSFSGHFITDDGNVYTYLVPDNAWSETGVTWNSRPPSLPQDLGSWWLRDILTTPQPLQVGLNYNPKLTAPVQQALALDQRISFRLAAPGSQTVYRSREHAVASERPRLIITYFDAADPQVTGELQTVALPAVADTQALVTQPNTNFGAATTLTVDRSAAETFLRFGLGAIPANARVAAVTLLATSHDGYAYDGADGNVYTRLVQSDLWSETNLTWGNRPATASEDLGSWLLWNRNGQYATQVGINSSPKLVAPVQEALGTDGLISFKLNSPGYRTLYHSREYAATPTRRPQLLVTYVTPPPCQPSNGPMPVQVVLEPEADTSVTSGAPGTNFGTGNLAVSPTEETYLRFNLGSLPPGARLASVMLQAVAFDGAAPGGDGNVYTRLVPDDSWSETDMTWSNRPTAATTDLGSWWLSYGSSYTKPLQVGLNYNPKLMAPVQQALDSDGLVSFRLSSTGYRTVYRSREHAVASDRPRLIIQYFDAADSQVTGSLQVLALPAVADAQVLASSPNTNFGTATDLIVDRSEAETFLRFSLAGVPANAQVAAVTLVATSHDIRPYPDSADDTVSTRLVTQDGWSETGITWGTKPTALSCALGGWLPRTGTARYTTQAGINTSPGLVAPVQQALGTDKLISFRLDTAGDRMLYHSREYTAAPTRQPQLLVSYFIPPPCDSGGVRAPRQVVLAPEADLLVNAWQPQGKFGTGLLAVGPHEESYLRFNLGSIPPGARIASVMLRAVANSGDSRGGDDSVYTYLVPDDTWSELETNWLNKPAWEEQALGSWWLYYGVARAGLQVGLNFDPKLTAPVQQAVDSDRRISFRLATLGSYGTTYLSRDTSILSERPFLVVNYFDPMDPQVQGALQTVALPAVADAQVLASSPDTNLGTSSVLGVDGREAETFLRFSLAGIPAHARVAAVSLVATTYEGSARSGMDNSVYTRPVQDDTWSEAGITWNNKPRTYACELGSWQVWTSGAPYEVQEGVNSSPKLVAPVQQALATTGELSLRLDSPGGRSLYHAREWPETAVRKPHLIVSYFVPTPAP